MHIEPYKGDEEKRITEDFLICVWSSSTMEPLPASRYPVVVPEVIVVIRQRQFTHKPGLFLVFFGTIQSVPETFLSNIIHHLDDIPFIAISI